MFLRFPAKKEVNAYGGSHETTLLPKKYLTDMALLIMCTSVEAFTG